APPQRGAHTRKLGRAHAAQLRLCIGSSVLSPACEGETEKGKPLALCPRPPAPRSPPQAGRASICISKRPRSHLPLDHQLLERRDRLGGIEALRTGLRAVHDLVAAIEAERILEV